MVNSPVFSLNFAVALLAEGVDRNTSALPNPQKSGQSPSSRRAWIEMTTV